MVVIVENVKLFMLFIKSNFQHQNHRKQDAITKVFSSTPKRMIVQVMYPF